MPLPAGTGLSRRSFLARSSGLALAVFGGAALAPRALDAGIAAAEAAGEHRVLVSIFCSGGLDSLSLLAPVGDPRYATLRGALALPADPAYAFGEDARLRWHPAAAPLRDLHAAGKLSVIPAIGYDDPNQSHFTSRHYWEVGAIDPAGRVGWLGRYLDRHGAADNPLQGLSLDYTLAPSLATSGVPVAAVSAPESYDLWARDVWDDALFDAAVSRWGAPGLARDRRPGARHRPPRRRHEHRAAQPARRPAGPHGRLAGRGRLPGVGERVPRAARLARGDARPRACRCASSRSTPTAATTRTRTRPPRCRPTSACCRPRWPPSRPTSRRAGSPTACSCTSGASSAAGPQANGSGTDHGAGGASLVMGTRATGTMVGEFPGLATLDAQSNLATRSTSARSTRASRSSGSRSPPTGSSPAPERSPRPRWCDEARCSSSPRVAIALRRGAGRRDAATKRARQAARGRRRRCAPRPPRGGRPGRAAAPRSGAVPRAPRAAGSSASRAPA